MGAHHASCQLQEHIIEFVHALTALTMHRTTLQGSSLSFALLSGDWAPCWEKETHCPAALHSRAGEASKPLHLVHRLINQLLGKGSFLRAPADNTVVHLRLALHAGG